VRVAITARRAASPIRVGTTMRVWGVVRLAKPRKYVSLQGRATRSDVAHAAWRRTDASSRFSFVYRATHPAYPAQVRFPGDATTSVRTAAVSRFTVF
jgi:hypothetical protein